MSNLCTRPRRHNDDQHWGSSRPVLTPSVASIGVFGITSAGAAIYCGGGVCNGTNSGEFLIGSSGWDDIYGKGGSDHLYGKQTGDDLRGGDQNDYIEGNPGNDVIRGQKGNDSRICNTLDCGLMGGNGNDLIFGFDGRDTLEGGAGEDVMEGNNNDDIFRAYDNKRDVIYGGHGNDICIVDSKDVYYSC